MQGVERGSCKLAGWVTHRVESFTASANSWRAAGPVISALRSSGVKPPSPQPFMCFCDRIREKTRASDVVRASPSVQTWLPGDQAAAEIRLILVGRAGRAHIFTVTLRFSPSFGSAPVNLAL